MQMTGTFGNLNSGLTGQRKRQPAVIKTALPRSPATSVGRLPTLPGENTGVTGKAPVNAFTGMQPMLQRALGEGANSQSPLGNPAEKFPRRKKAVPGA